MIVSFINVFKMSGIWGERPTRKPTVSLELVHRPEKPGQTTLLLENIFLARASRVLVLNWA